MNPYRLNDAIQEVMLVVCKGLHKLLKQPTIKGWVSVVASNKVCDLFREKARLKKLLDRYNTQSSRQPEGCSDPAEIIAFKEEVESFFALLTPREKLVMAEQFDIEYLEEKRFTCKEIAEKTGLSTDMVKRDRANIRRRYHDRDA